MAFAESDSEDDQDVQGSILSPVKEVREEEEEGGEEAAEADKAEREMDLEAEVFTDAKRVQNLGFSFEMFTLWATIKMAKRWSNDCDEHVKGIVQGREHIFGSAESVLSQLPKLTTKFCSFKELSASSKGNGRVSDDDFSHRPISIELLRSSTYSKPLPSIERFNTKAILSIRKDYERFMQREVNDVAMYEELNLKLKSIGGIPGVNGNLWARSTWELASRNDLIARGQAYGGADDADLFHIRDSDLDIRLRMMALLAKNNPDDQTLRQIVGIRSSATYHADGPPTIPEWNRAKKERNCMLESEARRHKRQRQGQTISYAATPMRACTAFSSMLDKRENRRPARDDDDAAGGFDPMEHEVPPQRGV